MAGSQNIIMLGGGAFGTAIATALAHNNHNVLIWCHEPELALTINKEKENILYLPKKKLPSNIQATSDLKEAIQFGTIIFEAIPVKHLRSILDTAKKYITPEHQFVLLSKGMEEETLLLPTQIITNIYGPQIKTTVISGPNFARDIAEQKLSTAVISSNNQQALQEIKTLAESSFLKLFPSQDLLGVQLCAVMKNVITLMIGIGQSAHFGENAIAYLVTYGLTEMQKLITSFQGNFQTAYDLCGIGDLLLTGFGTQSRNLRVGQLLGQNKSLSEIEKLVKNLPEGINSVQAINKLANQKKLHLPLCKGIYDIIFQKISPNDFIKQFIPNNEN